MNKTCVLSVKMVLTELFDKQQSAMQSTGFSGSSSTIWANSPNKFCITILWFVFSFSTLFVYTTAAWRWSFLSLREILRTCVQCHFKYNSLITVRIDLILCLSRKMYLEFPLKDGRLVPAIKWDHRVSVRIRIEMKEEKKRRIKSLCQKWAFTFCKITYWAVVKSTKQLIHTDDIRFVYGQRTIQSHVHFVFLFFATHSSCQCGIEWDANKKKLDMMSVINSANNNKKTCILRKIFGFWLRFFFHLMTALLFDFQCKMCVSYL